MTIWTARPASAGPACVLPQVVQSLIETVAQFRGCEPDCGPSRYQEIRSQLRPRQPLRRRRKRRHGHQHNGHHQDCPATSPALRPESGRTTLKPASFIIQRAIRPATPATIMTAKKMIRKRGNLAQPWRLQMRREPLRQARILPGGQQVSHDQARQAEGFVKKAFAWPPQPPRTPEMPG